MVEEVSTDSLNKVISVNTIDEAPKNNEATLNKYLLIKSLIDKPFTSKYERKTGLIWTRLDSITNRKNFDYAYLGSENLCGYIINFPRKKIGIGEQWRDTIGRMFPGEPFLTEALLCKLVDIKNDTAIVNIAGIIFEGNNKLPIGELEAQYSIDTVSGSTIDAHSSLHYATSAEDPKNKIKIKYHAECNIKRK